MMNNIEKLAIDHGIDPAGFGDRVGTTGKYFCTIEQLEAFAKAYADNQEMYLLKVLADIRQAMGNADKLMLDELAPAIAKACALQSSEPVAIEALKERDRLGHTVVQVIGTLDEIIEQVEEITLHDVNYFAVPAELWHELEDELEKMPERAELYTSTISKEWVGLSDAEALKLWDDLHPDSEQRSKKDYWLAIEAKLKQLNVPEKG